MSKKETIYDCRTGEDFIATGEAQGCEVVRGGRHTKLRKDGRSVPIPTHGSHELPIGTRRSIIRSLLALGLKLLILAVLLGWVWFYLLPH